MRSFLSACLVLPIMTACAGMDSAELSPDDPYARLSHFKVQFVTPQATRVVGGPAGAPEMAYEDGRMKCDALLEGPCTFDRLGEKKIGPVTADQLERLMTDYQSWLVAEARKAADSGNAEAANWLAYHYAVRGENLETALTLVDMALAVAPEQPAVLDTKGLILHKMGQHQQAEPFLIGAAQGDPSPEHIKHYADNAMAMGRLSLAEQAYERALAADPAPFLRMRIESRLHRIRQRTGRAR